MGSGARPCAAGLLVITVYSAVLVFLGFSMVPSLPADVDVSSARIPTDPQPRAPTFCSELEPRG